MKQEYNFSVLKTEAKEMEKVVQYLDIKCSSYPIQLSLYAFIHHICVFNADTSRTHHYIQEERRPANQMGLLMMQELGHFLCAALVYV